MRTITGGVNIFTIENGKETRGSWMHTVRVKDDATDDEIQAVFLAAVAHIATYRLIKPSDEDLDKISED